MRVWYRDGWRRFTCTAATTDSRPAVHPAAVHPALIDRDIPQTAARVAIQPFRSAVVVDVESGDIGAAVAYLASADADWITAQVLTADGGLITAGGTA